MKPLLVTAILALQLFTSQAIASLIISPTRVVFEERDRGQTVNIINSSNKAQTYRIDVVTNRQLPNGDYQRINNRAEANELYSAAEMLRYSPKQVTLQPHERQTIRLGLRKPQNLAAGEYRAHLGFTQLPSAELLDSNAKAQGIKIHMLTSFTIPVQVLNGPAELRASITDFSIKKNKDSNGTAFVDIERQGDFAVVGNLTVYWQPNAQTQWKQVAFLDNATLYREVNKRTIPLNIKGSDLKNGNYKVIYRTSKPYNPLTIGEVTVSYSN